MRPLFVFSLLFNLLLSACTSGSQSPDPVFTITTKNETDQVVIENRGDSTFIDVQSPSGIGSAVFVLEAGAMPERLTINLHLAGLEEIRVISDETAVSASFSSSQGATNSTQSIISSGEETPITSIHPLWLNIKVVSDQTTPKIPLEQGYFAVELPEAFLASVGDSFEIRWIDFYR